MTQPCSLTLAFRCGETDWLPLGTTSLRGTLLAQGKEENVGRRKLDRKDGLVFKLSDYKATFSLDTDEGLEASAFVEQPSVEDMVAHREQMQQLYAAIGTLSQKLANRVYAYFFLDMSMTEIAQPEGVAQSSVSESIQGALKILKKYF